MPARIIVCDDDAHIYRAISMKLSKAGYDVETASDGQAGWEAVRRSPPDMLITDLQMPRMSGLDLARRLRSQPETASVPIVLLTAKGFELDEAGLVRELAPFAVAVKPFSPRELLELVQRTLAPVEPACA